jgi:arylsulfatase A-like enzyme
LGLADGLLISGSPFRVYSLDSASPAIAAMRLLTICLFLLAASLHATPPNLVIFLADDAGWGDYGASGNQQLKTPSIDSIAKSGVSLDRFYVCPVCAPTRAEFLTGRYHPRTGVKGVSTGQERLNLDEKTLPDALKAAGYATGAFGKWHNGSQWPYHPMARGFDEYFGHTSGHWGEYFDAPLEDKGRMVRTRGYIVDVCTDRALDFIDRNKTQPFFCYIPFTTPHSPWAAPESDWARFKDKPITQTATQPDLEKPDETRCAYAMLENQDRNVGRILDRLKQHGLSDDTIVVYFSDNGPNSNRWTGGMKGKKGQPDEGGVRSVCYISWPAQLPAGRTVTQISGAIDLMPTLLALMAVPRVGDKPLDGLDLTPLLKATATDWPERLIFSTWASNISVRTQTHRLDSQGQLFDMIADPGQTKAINSASPGAGRKTATSRLRLALRNVRHPRKPKTRRKRQGQKQRSKPTERRQKTRYQRCRSPPHPGRLPRVPDHHAASPRWRTPWHCPTQQRCTKLLLLRQLDFH